MSVGETAEIPVSWALASVLPAGRVGSGTGTIDQAVPSQCSTSALAVALRPAAQALVGLSATTPSKWDFDPPVAAGAGTLVHEVPFQCSMSGLVLAKLIMLVEPTAHTSLAPEPPTARSFSSKRRVLGTVNRCHRWPFQC